MPSSLLASLLAVAAAMALLAPSCVAFVPGPPSSKRAASTVLAKGIKTNEDREVDANNAFQKTWNGGAFAEDPEANLAAAAGIASRIRSVGDLGWTSPPRRRGATRPRHRAWGGTGEAPIQLKPNYDEANPNCPEKWLAVEEFYSLSKDSTAAADTVFVALAGGGGYAEREVCEKKLAEWRTSGPRGGAFDEAKFLAAVKQGRTELAIGWASFLGTNGLFLSCIVAPTNPFAKTLEALVDQVKESAL